MGTHSYIIMRVKQEDGSFKTWYQLFVHWDGYPEGVGAKLCGWLQGITLVNGIPMVLGPNTVRYANGAPCLFAQVVKFFKTPEPSRIPQGLLPPGLAIPGMSGEAGNCYLYPADSGFEEWNYYVDVDEVAKEIGVQVFQDPEKILFSGSPKEGLTWCKNHRLGEEEEEEEEEDEIK